MISVTILTKNSEKMIEKVLEPLKDFDEVLIYDTGSTDQTLELVKRFSNVTICTAPFEGFGACHNKASGLARYDWVLSLDSDEVMTQELIQEIRSLKLCPDSVYAFPRKNFYNGKWIRWCGWHPDRIKRLYNRKRTSFSNAEVHEQVIDKGMKLVHLRHAVEHYSYEGTHDFLCKMQRYTDLFARQNAGKKKSSFAKSLFRGIYTFVKNYVFQRGFLGGAEGFTISLYNANTAFYKYLKLHEANRALGLKSSDAPKKKQKSPTRSSQSKNVPQSHA